MKACACIYVEFNLEKGLLEAVQLTLDNWTDLQPMDYDQLPFTCKIFPKATLEQTVEPKGTMEAKKEENIGSKARILAEAGPTLEVATTKSPLWLWKRE
jgi:hypothetical protein